MSSSKSFRSLQQVILTACALTVAAALLVAFPWRLVALLYLPSLPLALTLLWLMRDVPSPEERSARADAERVRHLQHERPVHHPA